MTQRTEPKVFQQVEEGNIKVATTRVDVAADGTEQFVIQAPSNTDKKAEILEIDFTTEGLFTLDYKKDFTIDTNGTSFDVFNARTGNSDTTNLTLEYGGSYSGTSKVGETLLPGSTTKKGSGTSTSNTELLVSNGTELMFDVKNQNDSQAQLISVTVVYLEQPT